MPCIATDTMVRTATATGITTKIITNIVMETEAARRPATGADWS